VRKFIPIILFLLAILQSGCNDVISIDSASFKKLWNDSINNSSVSWWYLGESDNQYYVAEKWPTKKTTYSISKKDLAFEGISLFEFASGNKPINLKNENILFK